MDSADELAIAGPAADALASLTPAQVTFLRSVEKAELHAHLNGSIPIGTLKELAREYARSDDFDSSSKIAEGVQKLAEGVKLEKIEDFFSLFGTIYALTSTPLSLGRATRAVLETFLGPSSNSDSATGSAPTTATTTTVGEGTPQCTYLELRTTPRQTHSLTYETYLRVVLSEIDRYPADKLNLIVSLGRHMAVEVLEACLGVIEKLVLEGERDGSSLGKRIVGIDICGDPYAGEVSDFQPFLDRAKRLGLGVTVHIAETIKNTAEETLDLLSYLPDRLGHATFLDETAQSIVLERKIPIELCLSSNLLCKTVTNLETHHIHQYLRSNHPIAICTDDILPFRTSLLGEYALLLAQPPLGLGLSEEEVTRIGRMSLEARFGHGGNNK